MSYVFKEGDEIKISVDLAEGKISMTLSWGENVETFEIPNSFNDLKKAGFLYAAIGMQKKKGNQLLVV